MHKPRKLDLVSMYLSQPAVSHGITLHLAESGPGHMKGTIRRDPNTCTLDLWGDRGACTKMGALPQDVTATMMRTYDPHGHKRIHWRLEIEGVSDAKWNLIEYPRANLWYLTVQPETGGGAVVPLFDAALFATDAVGTVQTRYGVALRDVLHRGEVEEMRAEAELVRRALAELDAKPGPEARHVSSIDPAHVAEVRAALAELEAALARVKD